jgi:hypothetical protein
MSLVEAAVHPDVLRRCAPQSLALPTMLAAEDIS